MQVPKGDQEGPSDPATPAFARFRVLADGEHEGRRARPGAVDQELRHDRSGSSHHYLPFPFSLLSLDRRLTSDALCFCDASGTEWFVEDGLKEERVKRTPEVSCNVMKENQVFKLQFRAREPGKERDATLVEEEEEMRKLGGRGEGGANWALDRSVER